jgi:hydrogenase maturation protease
MKITLLGLGNILMRDDGVGVHAVKAVQQGFEVPPELEIVDGGTAGLDLLPFLEGRDRVLLVDAVDFGAAPGFIGELANDAIPAFFSQNRASLHHLGLGEVLATAQLLNILPPDICLLGIQPLSIETGLELTEVLQGKLDLLVARIVGKLADWGVHLAPRVGIPPPETC